jgi:hypothetical protein
MATVGNQCYPLVLMPPLVTKMSFTVNKYLQLTVANYTLDDFKTNFRLTRMTFESTYLQLGPLPEYNNAHGPIPDVQKDLLMFLWYISMHH